MKASSLPQIIGFDIMFTRNRRWLEHAAGAGGD
jgi:hypothetical protein